jgi:hypothetical protein
MTAIGLFEPAQVWLRRGSLDRSLAHGADPTASRALARRARQLTSRRCRRGLADGIRNLVDEAEAPSRGYTAAAPPQRREILREQDVLLALAADLAGDDEVSPRGVALIEALLTDGTSPIYAPGPEGALHRALIHARAALYLG